MVYPKLILRFLCGLYVIYDLVMVVYDGREYVMTKTNYGKFYVTKHKDLFLRNGCEVNIKDRVRNMVVKYHLRPSKDVFKGLVSYSRETLREERYEIMVNNSVSDIIDGLKNKPIRRIIGLLKNNTIFIKNKNNGRNDT